MGLFTFAFLVMGIVILARVEFEVKQYVAYVFFAATIASLYALWIVVRENRVSLKIMKNYVREMTSSPTDLRPVECCRGNCRLSPPGGWAAFPMPQNQALRRRLTQCPLPYRIFLGQTDVRSSVFTLGDRRRSPCL